MTTLISYYLSYYLIGRHQNICFSFILYLLCNIPSNEQMEFNELIFSKGYEIEYGVVIKFILKAKEVDDSLPPPHRLVFFLIKFYITSQHL